MAKIDLKNAYVRLVDGGENTSKSGAINNVAGYPIGTTVLTVDGFTGAVETGGRLLLGGRYYVITAHTETTGNTTSITIASPGLKASVLDDAVIVAYDKRESITIKMGDGTLTWSEKRNVEYTTDRGKLDEVRLGDEVPVDVSIDAVWEYISGPTAGVPTIRDVLYQEGLAASWVSSDTDACRPYAVDIEIEYTPACAGDIEIITLSDYRFESFDADIKAGTLKTSGKCNITKASAVRIPA